MFKKSKPLKKHILQVDLFNETETNTLDRKHLKSIKNSMSILNRLTLRQPNKRLEEFKKAFIKRYENEELPLTTILDTEIGIGYSKKLDKYTPFLEDIYLPQKRKKSKNVEWSIVDDILLNKVLMALNKNKYSIMIGHEDFEGDTLIWEDLPDTMSSIVEIITQDEKERLIINAFGGSSAGNLLARFGHGSDGIHEQVKTISNIEKSINSDKILAEIIHIPQARTGNILRRSKVRDYEIPFLGASDLPKEKQIPLTDIFVSIQHNKIILRSKRLGKEILPRLTNAHNFSNGLPIYLFLCDLQYQDKCPSIGFHWNNIFEKFSFLPRIEHKNIILSKAQWNIKTSTIDNLFSLNDKELIGELKKWQSALHMPDLIQLVDRDNLLLINMNNITCIKMFLNIIKKRRKFKLVEFLQSDNKIVTRDGKSFCNEFVISVYNNEKLNNQKNGN